MAKFLNVLVTHAFYFEPKLRKQDGDRSESHENFVEPQYKTTKDYPLTGWRPYIVNLDDVKSIEPVHWGTLMVMKSGSKFAVYEDFKEVHHRMADERTICPRYTDLTNAIEAEDKETPE